MHKEVSKEGITKERLDIGRRVYEHLLTKEEAARKYGVSVPCIYVCVREYMTSIGIEPLPKGTKRVEPARDYRSMTKNEIVGYGLSRRRGRPRHLLRGLGDGRGKEKKEWRG